MSVVQPSSADQVASWQHRDSIGYEPVILELPGWSVSVGSTLPNERVWRYVYQSATITLIRSWDRPLSPGGPMSVTSTRSVTTAAGARFEVQTTSMFHGAPKVVDVVFLNGPGWVVQVVFEGCPPHGVDDTLGRLRFPPPPHLAAPGGAAPGGGFDVVIESSSINMPPRCASCGAPKETTVNTSSARRSGNRTIRRTFAIPYCASCAARAKSARNRKALTSFVGFALALILATIELVFPGLPIWVLLPMTTVIAFGAAFAVSTALAPPAPPLPAVARGEAVRLVSFKDARSVLHCVHPDWAADLARGNGTMATPKVRRVHFATAALVFAGILTPLTAVIAWVVTNPSVYIDNAGKEALAIWVDGEVVSTAAPTSHASKPSHILVPYGKHRFGYSPVGSSVPVATIDARVSMFDAHLYNPAKTACYWLVANSYGSASVAGVQQGPQPIREFYSFDKVDTWFGENPQTIQVSNGQSGDTRIALQRARVCMDLAERGCDSDARAKFMECQRAATSDAAMDACDEQATCARHAPPAIDLKGPAAPSPPPAPKAAPAAAKPAATHATSAAPRPTPAPAKSK
jgi:hypothetical protein